MIDRKPFKQYEIELLFNRASKKTVDNLFQTTGSKTQLKKQVGTSESCELCKASNQDYLDKTNVDKSGLLSGETMLNDNIFVHEYKWYEGLAYYGTLTPEDGTSVIEPRDELKQMLETQLKHFGQNHDYSDMNTVLGLASNILFTSHLLDEPTN